MSKRYTREDAIIIAKAIRLHFKSMHAIMSNVLDGTNKPTKLDDILSEQEKIILNQANRLIHT